MFAAAKPSPIGEGKTPEDRARSLATNRKTKLFQQRKDALEDVIGEDDLKVAKGTQESGAVA